MGFAIQCGSCNQQFTVEQDGGIVECPHCKTALQLPDRPADPGDVPVAPESTIEKSNSPNLPESDVPANPGSGVLSEEIAAGLPETTDSGAPVDPNQFAGLPGDTPVSDVDIPMIDTGSAAKLAGPDSATALAEFSKTLGDPPPDPNEATVMDVNLPEIDTGDEPKISGPDSATAFAEFSKTLGDPPPDPNEATVMDVDLQQDLRDFVPKLETHPTDPTPPAPAEKGAESAAPSTMESKPPVTDTRPAPVPEQASAGVSKTVFFAVCGYAAAVTLVLIWSLIRKAGGVNLPDVVPQPKGYIISEDTELPEGHRLQIGQTGRYGHLEITPIKVVRGPVQMVFPGESKPVSTEPVITLHLKIRNVSKRQSFQPFGRPLLMMRGTSDADTKDRANIFLCKASEKQKGGHLVYVYPLEGYQLKGQQLDRLLDPGDEYETFIASNDEGLDKLTGDLIWRVHVRKGYNPDTENGVTTIFEVSFHSDEIKAAGSGG